MLKRLFLTLSCLAPLCFSSQANAVANGIELNSVDIPMEGATISIPGLTDAPIKKSSDCNSEEEKCPDIGFEYYFDSEIPLEQNDMGTATIKTEDGTTSSTFTSQPLGGVTLTPVVKNADDLIIAWIDPLLKEHTLTYDSIGHVIAKTDEADIVTRYAYDGLDRRVSRTNSIDETTRYEYDSAGRKSAEISPSGTRSEYRYDPDNDIFRVSDYTGTTTYQYDAMGRVIRSTDPSGASTGYQYDSFGRSIIRTGEDGTGLRTTYDAAGRKIAETAYDFEWSPYDPIDVGPKSKVGTESTESKIAKAAVGQALGSIFGGFGGGGKTKKPKTKRDPARRADKSELYDEATDTKLEIRPNWVDDKLHVSVYIKDSDDKATFQYIYLVDQNGNVLGPEKVELYKIWVKHTLTVSWTQSTYVDGALVSQTSGGWTESWVTDLGTFKVGQNPLSNVPGIWQTFGYDRAHAGARTVGATFNISPSVFDELGPLNLVTHVSRPKLDPVSTIPFIGQLFRNGEKDFKVEPLILVKPTIIQAEES